jgi:hypothetical protein
MDATNWFSEEKGRIRMKIVICIISFFISSIIPTSEVIAVNAQYIITQQDENEIIRLTEEFNTELKKIYRPFSSIKPYGDFERLDVYQELMSYDTKLVPYLIRQIQINDEAKVFVGSVLATREIKDPEDLHVFNTERAGKLREGIFPWFGKFDGAIGDGFPNWTLLYILSQTTIGKQESPGFMSMTYRFKTRFSWTDWWKNNKQRFDFQTDNPFVIDTGSIFFDFPHISTEKRNDLLTIDAVHATYRQIIERVAAEAGIEVFIGENEEIGVLTSIRMRAVTFEEFTHHLGYDNWSFRAGHGFRKIGNKFHFGGEEEAKPRKIFWGQGIMMRKTVFHEGDSMPVTIIARNTKSVTIPLEPDSLLYGSFKITSNDGMIVKDITRNEKLTQYLNVVEIKKDSIEFELDISKYYMLSPGEYNVSFIYHEQETPTISIEVYAKGY